MFRPVDFPLTQLGLQYRCGGKTIGTRVKYLLLDGAVLNRLGEENSGLNDTFTRSCTCFRTAVRVAPSSFRRGGRTAFFDA